MSWWDWFRPKPPVEKPPPAGTVSVDFNVKVETDPLSDAPPVAKASVHLIGDHDEIKPTNDGGWVRFEVKHTARLITVDVTPPPASGLQHYRRDGMAFDGKPHTGDAAYNLYLAPVVVIPDVVPPALTISGTSWCSKGAYYLPRWLSYLSALRPDRSPADWKAYASWASRHSFTGVRVFAGYLGWANQSAQQARERLTAFLDAMTAAGLAVEVTAITGSADGDYDPKAHLRDVANLCRGRANVVLELANEVGHGSQNADVNNPDTLRAWGRELCQGIVWAVGAPVGQDEPSQDGTYPCSGGAYCTAHLDRGRDFWNQVRRVREIYAVADTQRVPCLNNEPIGAAEATDPGRRESDPVFFLTMGVLDACFGVGGVHHSQSGLDAVLPGAVQVTCADAYVRGSSLITAAYPADALHYANTPYVDQGAFASSFSGATRLYHFNKDGRGFSVAIGAEPSFTAEWIPLSKRVEVLNQKRQADDTRLIVWEVAK